MGNFEQLPLEQSSAQPPAGEESVPGHNPPILCRGETRPDVIERLEHLDDVIFAAIDGDPKALDESTTAWQTALEELGRETLEETRQQYVRHARSVWDGLRSQDVPPADRIFATIEIIGLLANPAL